MKEKRMDANFRQRLQRRFHYGDLNNLDVPSLPLTELAVDYFHHSIPEKLGHVDLYSASDIIRRNGVSPCSVVLSMLYAKRLRQQTQRNKDLLQTMSSADVFFISVMMASKYLYDEGVDEEVFNEVWAENADQDVEDVNQMERNYLQAMDWRLFVRPQEFEDTMAYIERRLALQEGFKRGWYTYAEMDILMTSNLMWSVWSNVGWECSKLLTAISSAYLTSVFSLMGSTALAVQVSVHLSSAAVTILALQLSPLMQPVSTGMNSPMAALPASLVSVPPSIRQSDTLETSISQIGSTGFNTREESKSAAWSRNNKWHDELEKEPISALGSEETGSGNDSRPTEHDGYGNYEPSILSTKSTSRSTWFFDSLASQVWAVICIRSNLAIFNWSFSSKVSSPKEPDTFVDSTISENGLNTRHVPKFRRRQKDCSSQNKDPADRSTRKLTHRQKTTSNNTSTTDQTPTAVQELFNPHEVASQDNLCSDHYSELTSWTDPWHCLPQTSHCRNDPLSSHDPCQHSFKSLSNLPEEPNPLMPVTDHVTDYFIHHICIGHICRMETNHHAGRQHLNNDPPNMLPSRGTTDNCQISQRLQTGLEIPKGFFTSVSHAILAT